MYMHKLHSSTTHVFKNYIKEHFIPISHLLDKYAVYVLWKMKHAKNPCNSLLSGLGDVEPESCTFFNISIKIAAVNRNVSMLKQCNIVLIKTCSM